MDLNCPYQNWGKTLYCTCQTHSWKYFYNSKQVDSDSCNIENNLEITILFCLTSLHLTFLPKNNDGYGLSISMLRVNTLLHMSNIFLEIISLIPSKLIVTVVI